MKLLQPVLLAAPAADGGLPGALRVAARSAHARVALARSAHRSGARLGRLEKDARDAPRPSDGWHWSVSHTHGFSAGVVARAPVGIDVEAVRPRDQGIVRAVASRGELDLLGGFTWAAFFRIWTAKEAVLKKAGCGILELSDCTLIAAPDAGPLVLAHRRAEHVVHQSLRAGHVAALCCEDPLPVDWAWDLAEAVVP